MEPIKKKKKKNHQALKRLRKRGPKFVKKVQPEEKEECIGLSDRDSRREGGRG